MYSITLANFENACNEGLLELMQEFHEECQSKCQEDIGKFNPRLDVYETASYGKYLITYLLKLDEQLIGYCIIFLDQNMHTSELLAEEDSIYIRPEYRNGIGTKLAKFIL